MLCLLACCLGGITGLYCVGAVLDGRPHSATPLTVTAGSRQPPNPKPKLSSNNILLLLPLLQSPRRRLTAVLYCEPSREGQCLVVLPFFVSAPCYVFGCVKSPPFSSLPTGRPSPLFATGGSNCAPHPTKRPSRGNRFKSLPQPPRRQASSSRARHGTALSPALSHLPDIRQGGQTAPMQARLIQHSPGKDGRFRGGFVSY